MKALIIDTSTEKGLVAVAENGKVQSSAEFFAGQNTSKNLLPLVDEELRKNSISPSALSYIATGVGPGSYTGIRIAAAFAKGMSIPLSLPLVALSSLSGFIPPASYEGQFISCIDAKISGFYVRYGKKGEDIVFSSEDEIISLENFQKRNFSNTLIVTPLAAPIEKRLGLFSLSFFESFPNADYLAKCAHSSFLKKEYFLPDTLPLLYLRKTQAEIERNSKTMI
jgi:tRNA threonylcarbamoyladenosine biosynthesis protein TsaB